MYRGTSRAIVAITHTLAYYLEEEGKGEIANAMKIAVLQSLEPEGIVDDAAIGRWADTVADIERDALADTHTVTP